MNARLKACLALMLTLAFNLESAVINQVSAQPQVGFSATPTKPKLVVMLLVLLIAGPWMLQFLVDYIERLFASIPQLIG